MAPPSNTLTAYDAIGNREDLSDIIYDISPTDTPFLNGIPTTDATAVNHEWQTHALTAATADNKVEEGLDASTDASTTTTRRANRTQISDKVPRVSGTQEVVNKAGRRSEMGFQVTNKARELKRDMEMRLVCNQAKVTGASGTAAETAGVLSWLKTNESVGAGGSAPSAADGAQTRTAGMQRAFTEAQMKTVLAACFDSGGDPDMIIVNGFNKQAMSGFTGNATRMVGAGEEKLYASIDVYKSDFGDLQVVPSRFMETLTQKGDHALILQMDMWAIAYLRPFQLHDLSKTGDSEQKQLLAEYALEARNEAASGVVADLTVS
jgi:hypothetical protein